MEIREIMTPSVDLIGPATTIKDAAVHMRDGDVGALPVGENDQLIGMVTDRDITVRGVASARSPDTCTVREVMSEGIYYCFEDEDVQRASRTMTEHKVRRLPILNREKRLVGIVALADLAKTGIAEDAVEGVSTPTPEERL